MTTYRQPPLLRFRVEFCFVLLSVLSFFPKGLYGMDQHSDESSSRSDESLSKVADKATRVHLKTLGGRQFWGDLAYFHGWRIQQHVLTKHCRLLDPDDYRSCSGTLAECQVALNKVRLESKKGPMSGHAVILVHGIIRSSKSLNQNAPPMIATSRNSCGF